MDTKQSTSKNPKSSSEFEPYKDLNQPSAAIVEEQGHGITEMKSIQSGCDEVDTTEWPEDIKSLWESVVKAHCQRSDVDIDKGESNTAEKDGVTIYGVKQPIPEALKPYIDSLHTSCGKPNEASAYGKAYDITGVDQETFVTDMLSLPEEEFVLKWESVHIGPAQDD